MLLDSMLSFAAAQAVTATGDTASTNSVDCGPLDSGAGNPNYVLVRVAATFTSGGTPTLQAVMQDSANNSAFADVLAFPATALASLGANQLLVRAPVPVGLRRYLRIAWRVAGGTFTGGSVSAYALDSVQAQQLMPSGFVVA